MRIWGLVLLALVVGWFMGQRASTPPTAPTATPTVERTTKYEPDYSIYEDDSTTEAELDNRASGASLKNITDEGLPPPRPGIDLVTPCELRQTQWVMVKGKVAATPTEKETRSKLTFLELANANGDQCLTVAVWNQGYVAHLDIERFPCEPAQYYLGEKLRIEGLASIRDGRAFMLIDDPIFSRNIRNRGMRRIVLNPLS